MPHDLVFKVHGRDPLAAGLYDVLRAVGDLGEAAIIQSASVAGAKPAVVEALRRRIFVIRGGDPGTAHLDLADRLAVPRQLVSLVVGDAHLNSGEGASRLRAPFCLLVLTSASRRPGEGGDRRGLGHAPALRDPDARLFMEPLDEREGNGRAA